MNAADLPVRDGLVDDLGVRPGESDPAGMLSGVLVLLAVLVPVVALALALLLA
ncbi:MAG: hypothetical protein ACRDSH_16455 [Pseudonocardiaceae bacterium]